MAAVAQMARSGSLGRTGALNPGDGSSVLLEVGGELTVPSVESKEKLAELLASGKYVLDFSGAEIRMSDNVKQEVFEALGLKDFDEFKSRVVLNSFVSQAPPGSHELVRNFLRKGSREEHFAVVKELARMKREELEKAIKKPMPARRGSSGLAGAGLARTGSRSETPSTTTAQTQDVKVVVTGVSDSTAVKDKTPVTAGISEAKKEKTSRQPYDELSTFRSATTASDLGTARLISDV